MFDKGLHILYDVLMEKDFYSVQEFADKLGMHYNSIINAIRKGRISAFRGCGSKKGAYRISKTEIFRMSKIDLENFIQKEVEERIRNANQQR